MEKKILFGFANILAILVFLGFSGCKNETVDSDGGVLTVTNIPSEYNGAYAYFYAYNPGLPYICGAKDVNSNLISLVKVENNKVTLPLWILTEYGGDAVERYKGNDTYYKLSNFGSCLMLYSQGLITASTPCDLGSVLFEIMWFVNGNSTASLPQ